MSETIESEMRAWLKERGRLAYESDDIGDLWEKIKDYAEECEFDARKFSPFPPEAS